MYKRQGEDHFAYIIGDDEGYARPLTNVTRAETAAIFLSLIHILSGWEQDSRRDCLDFAQQMEGLGVETLIFTDISTDGMLSGPSVEWLAKLQRRVSCRVIASGGVSCNAVSYTHLPMVPTCGWATPGI